MKEISTRANQKSDLNYTLLVQVPTLIILIVLSLLSHDLIQTSGRDTPTDILMCPMYGHFGRHPGGMRRRVGTEV